MKRLTILFTLTLGILILFFTPIRTSAAQSGFAQTPTPTSDLRIESLKLEIESMRSEVDDSLRDYNWMMESTVLKISTIALAIGLIAGFIGIKTYREVDEKIKERITNTLEKELYRVDPTMKKIFVPSSLPEVNERLNLSHLRNIHVYEDLSKQNCDGITVVQIAEKSHEAQFLTFIEEYRKDLNPERVAFILYATGYRVDDKTITAFANTAVANMPVTVVSAILAVSRGITQ